MQVSLAEYRVVKISMSTRDVNPTLKGAAFIEEVIASDAAQT